MRNYLKTEKRKRNRENAVVCLYFIISIVIALVFVSLIKVITWNGQSMEPVLLKSDAVIVSAVPLIEGNFEHGDLIAYKCKVASEEGSRELVRRIVGLPGDVVEIKNGIVFLNNLPLNDNNSSKKIVVLNMSKRTVESNELFVLSDDLSKSCNGSSFELDFVDFEDVIGMVKFRIFPLKRFGLIE